MGLRFRPSSWPTPARGQGVSECPAAEFSVGRQGGALCCSDATSPSLFRVCCPGCQPFYREVMVYVPGGASVVALAALAILVLWTALMRRKRMAADPNPSPSDSQAHGSSSIQRSEGRVGSINREYCIVFPWQQYQVRIGMFAEAACRHI